MTKDSCNSRPETRTWTNSKLSGLLAVTLPLTLDPYALDAARFCFEPLMGYEAANVCSCRAYPDSGHSCTCNARPNPPRPLASKRVDLISNKLIKIKEITSPISPPGPPGGAPVRLFFRLARLSNRSRVLGENPEVSGQAPTHFS